MKKADKLPPELKEQIIEDRKKMNFHKLVDKYEISIHLLRFICSGIKKELPDKEELMQYRIVHGYRATLRKFNICKATLLKVCGPMPVVEKAVPGVNMQSNELFSTELLGEAF